MYNQKDLLRVLRRDLQSECDTIKFYLDNLEKLNYKSNRKKIDTLIFDSFKHATSLATAFVELNKSRGVVLNSEAAAKAFKEEVGLREIYAYEANKTQSPKIKKLLKSLSIAETRHEKIVKSLK